MPEPEIRPEERLLAALLRNPKKAPEVSIRASHTWFMSPSLEVAFESACEYACERGASPTRDMLLEMMTRRRPEFREAHPEALKRVYAVQAAPDEAQHVSYYCEALERDWKARTVKAAMMAAADMLDKSEIDGAIAALQKDIAIPLTRYSRAELGADFNSFWLDYERTARDPDLRFGVPTGFRTIDEATRGQFRKELWVMVGGPGVGKSLWLGQLAVNAAAAKKKVLLVTIENSRETFMRRLYSNLCQVDYKDLKTASLTEADKEKLFEGIAGLPKDYCLEVVHMEPPCCARDIVNVMRTAERGFDFLVVDQITNMAPNHPKEFRVMDWRWYSQIALELRVLGSIVYDGRGVPVHTAVHAAGGTTDKKELTTDDTALAKSIGYHADAMLYFTRKDAEYRIGKSKLRDSHFDPFEVFPVWSNWRLSEEPPREKYGSTIDGDRQERPHNPDTDFDVEALERETLAMEAADKAAAKKGSTVPDDFVPVPPQPAPPGDKKAPDGDGALTSEDL